MGVVDNKFLNNNVLIATVVSTKGLDGSVKLKCFLHNLSILQNNILITSINNNNYTITNFYAHSNLVIAKFKDINSIDQAKQLIGLDLYIARAALPNIKDDNVFYATDLINCLLIDKQDSVVGSVYGVQNFGAGDILQVKLLNGNNKMLSFNKNSIIKVMLLEKKIIINTNYLI